MARVLIGVNEPWLLPVALVAESILVLLFDWIFIKEMKSVSNYKVILSLDGVSLFFALLWVGLAAQALGRPDEWWAVIWFASFGALAFVFVIVALAEIWGYLVLFGKVSQCLEESCEPDFLGGMKSLRDVAVPLAGSNSGVRHA